MADTTIKLSGTYDSIEAYELLEEMRGVASDYLPLTGGEISGDLIVDGQLSADLTGNVTGTASGNLPLSGGTITGALTINQNSTVPLTLQTSSYNDIQATDGTNRIGLVRIQKDTTNSVNKIMLGVVPYASNTTPFGIEVSRDSSGTLTAVAPTPAANNNSTQIATTAWVQSNVKNTLTVQEKTGSAVSVNAGAVYTNATVNVALSGYTPIGIVGYEITGTNASYAMIVKMSLGGTTVNITGRNMASAAATWTPKVNILYVKN